MGLQQGYDGRWTHVMATVSHLTNLVIAYEQIQYSPGLMIHAIKHEIISFRHLHSSLAKQQYI